MALDPIILRELSIAFWSVVIGYYFLLAVYFLLVRYRRNPKPIHLSLSIFFLALAIGRVLLVVNDFFIVPSQPYNIFYNIGIASQWISLAAFGYILGIALFKRRDVGWIMVIPATIFSGFNAFAPVELLIAFNTPVNYIAVVIYAIVIPIMLLYIALQSPGIYRIGFLSMGAGFFILYAARAIHSEFVKAILTPLIGFDTIELGAPALAVFGLILVVWGSHVVFE